MSPLFVHKIILVIPTNTPFYNSTTVFSPPCFLQTTIPKIYTENNFPTSDIYPIQAEAKEQETREFCEDWYCFNLSFVTQSMENDSRAHNRWLLIAQAQKIDVLVFDEDACNRNDKLFNPPSHTLNPLSLLPYPTNTITRTRIPKENSYLTLFSSSYTIHAHLNPYAYK